MNDIWKFTKMTQQEAETIAEWKYPAPYDFYDMTADEEDYVEFIDPVRRNPETYSVSQGGSLIGFFSFTKNTAVDISLGLHPERTGKGEGEYFLKQVLLFGRSLYGNRRFTLAVAAFNKRAIRVYERCGFSCTKSFEQATNGDVFDFIAMEHQGSRTP
ncbi:GNAT family N-acetyltransferase [Halobacillus sp. ACCC02827]|uniref:GNAT family N-acetyltransferase n=1 Tax=Bacillaceae TaxID=186817 RepID=UPI0002A501A5|nr:MULTISPECIES: GNAT family N-acetyltransferase [Bacillaceae]ELK48971.1 GNAT family acetyltransferase [Halobacillus sp. BAB-2008]QHT48235.1 GNAT family N-acetyltransferase [Bacillus sp. SB49]WJE15468.1 GNAT family N-acetyltransferase [Halobacillus sp. ACCC02827]